MISAFIYVSESNGVQLRVIRLLAKFNLRISDESLRNLRQDGILKFHPFAKDALKLDGGICPAKFRLFSSIHSARRNFMQDLKI